MNDENAHVEFKSSVDLTNRESALKLIREVVAFANADGGTIRIGQSDDGIVVGVDSASLSAFDASRVSDKVNSFITPESLEIAVEREDCDGLVVVELRVPRFLRPPLVMAKDGTYGTGTTQATLFRKGDVYVRRGTKTEHATRGDFVGWIEAERVELLSKLRFVAELPVGSSVSAVVNDEEVDEPNTLLRRAARAWERNSEKLLTSTELVVVLVARPPVDLTHPSDRLVIHSSLRKRTTLWHWIERLQPSAAWVFEILEETMDSSDRDKSDSGGSIIDLSAIFLDDNSYAQVRERLARSKYKHFQNAAANADRHIVLERLQNQISTGFDPPLHQWSVEQLQDETEQLCRELLLGGRKLAERRRLSAIGLESFARTDCGECLRKARPGARH